MYTRLTRLRTALVQVYQKLIDAEAELADRLVEVNAFEAEIESRLGHLLDKLELLETEVQRYLERIEIVRNKQRGQQHQSVEMQYQHAWQQARPTEELTPPPPTPLNAAGEAEIKRLYRQLARHYHPDLATDETNRAYRTEMMAAINEAYAHRSLIELVALAQATDIPLDAAYSGSQEAESRLAQVLQAELARCQQRLRRIEKELRGLRYRPSVELSLEVKVARGQGRDLFAEMVARLEHKIAYKTAERDMLKAQIDQLGPEQGFIPISR